MKTRQLALLLGLLAFVPATARASDGIANLSWNDCGAAGHQEENFACDTNSGVHTLVGSFSMFVGLDSLVAFDAIVEMQSANPAIPGWWQLRTYTDGTPGCRLGSTGVSVDFTGGPFTCLDYWLGAGAGYLLIPPQANRQRLIVQGLIDAQDADPVPANVETYAFRLMINNTKTIGAGACGGCSSPMTLIMTRLDAEQPYSDLPSYRAETVGTYALWNSPPVSTRNKTWGAIKSLYW